jgi:hypothetical protein
LPEGLGVGVGGFLRENIWQGKPEALTTTRQGMSLDLKFMARQT